MPYTTLTLGLTLTVPTKAVIEAGEIVGLVTQEFKDGCIDIFERYEM